MAEEPHRESDLWAQAKLREQYDEMYRRMIPGPVLPTPLSEQRCGNCLFFKPEERNDEHCGACHRFPPVSRPVYEHDHEWTSGWTVGWPQIAESQWCGEWRVAPKLEGPHGS